MSTGPITKFMYDRACGERDRYKLERDELILGMAEELDKDAKQEPLPRQAGPSQSG